MAPERRAEHAEEIECSDGGFELLTLAGQAHGGGGGSRTRLREHMGLVARGAQQGGGLAWSFATVDGRHGCVNSRPWWDGQEEGWMGSGEAS